MARGRHGRRAHRGWKIAIVTVLVVSIVGAGTAYAAYRYDRSTADRILPGISIEGVDVSDMTRSQALREVTAEAQETLGASLTVQAAGRSWIVTPAALGMAADVEAAVNQAFAQADRMSFVNRVYHRVADKPIEASIDLAYAYDDAKIHAFVEQARDEVAVEAVDARFALVKDDVVMRRSADGQALRAQLAEARIRSALEERLGSVQIPVKVVEPEIGVGALGKTIVIDISDTTLVLYEGFKVQQEYRVATAAPGYTTPVGMWKVINKAENPSWTNPDPTGWGAGLPSYIPPGPGNPLGTRALYLNAPGIRIHGTYSSSSIGTHASHGCIRMLISDSEELFPLVPMGTRVIIKP
jgi:lipoprotein-anchoring transpeptidase ErfK/SrfK